MTDVIDPTLGRQYDSDLKWKSRSKYLNKPDTLSLGIEQPGHCHGLLENSHNSEPGGLLITSSKLPPHLVG